MFCLLAQEIESNVEEGWVSNGTNKRCADKGIYDARYRLKVLT